MVGNRQPMLKHRGCFATLGYRMVRHRALRFAVSASQEREPHCVGRYATPDVGHLVARAAKPSAVPLVKASSVWPVPASAQLLSFASIKKQQKSDGLWKHFATLFVIARDNNSRSLDHVRRPKRGATGRSGEVHRTDCNLHGG